MNRNPGQNDFFVSEWPRLDLSPLRTDLAALDRLAARFSATMSRGLADAVTGSRRLSDMLRGLAAQLLRLSLQAALRPLTMGLSRAATSLIGSLLGISVGTPGQALLPSARGNVIAGGRLVPLATGGMVQAGQTVRAFAHGGVVDTPVLFPMRGGLGLMGEAGPEAILPLARGPDGRLGVRAQGQGAPVQVVMHISTPDAEGFRRNRGRIAAELARAVAEGQRNL